MEKFFDRKLSIDIKCRDIELIDAIITKKDELYTCRNHFIRCAIRRLINKEMGLGD